MKSKPNILICPLDWGIGHATRCVPIINELLKQNANVILGASGRSLSFLKKEYPKLQFINFPGYQFSYPAKGNMALKMGLQAPKILKGIKEEHKVFKKIIQDYKIDAVISDNRYGLYSKNIPSIFMTHQVFIQTPKQLAFLDPFLGKINISYINKYNECWIPDYPGTNNLSGDLSHNGPLSKNCHFIGPLSRFDSNGKPLHTEFKYKILVMLSGPEPQRSILEKLILDQLSELQVKSAMVCGKPEIIEQKIINENIELFSHLETDKLENLIHESEIVVSRPGYSTIMDLVALNKKAIFIPTPGQTEQEYLAKYFSEKGYFYSMEQKKFNLSKGLEELEKFNFPRFAFDYIVLKERVSLLLERL